MTVATKEIKDFVRLQLDLNLARQDFTAGLLWGKNLLERTDIRRGNGRPVITLPGFGVPEASLTRLNGFLEVHGYVTRTYNGGIPEGETFHQFIDSEICPELSDLVQRLADETGETVSLVGQSAGGLYAREFARRFPEHLDRVITLGTPTFHPAIAEHANAALAYIVRRTSGMDDHDMIGGVPLLHWEADDPALPYVAIYSPVDGAVSEVEAAIPADIVSHASQRAPRENIAVYCSHFGMTMNPFVLIAIADRLGQDRLNWQPFDSNQYASSTLSKAVAGLAYPTDRPAVQRPGMGPPRPPAEASPTRAGNARQRVTNTLRDDHNNIVALLDAVEDSLKGRQRPDYQMVYDALHYLSRHADAYHHTREDFLFERLERRTRRFDPQIKALLDEHIDLSERAESLLNRMRRAKDLSTLNRNAKLNQACRAYARDLREHLQFEEKAVFAAALDKLKARDWIAIDAAIDYVDDPLFSKRIRNRYAQLSQSLGDTAEVVSEEALLLNFLEFEAFVESAQALGRGIGGLNSATLDAAEEAMRHNADAFRETLAARDFRTFGAAQVNAIEGNIGLLRSYLDKLTGVAMQAGREVAAPYRRQSREFKEAIKADWSGKS